MTSEDWRTLRVTSARPIASGVVELRLTDPSGEALPPWQPGAHLEVETVSGIRHYSLCGKPDDEDYTIAILRENEGRGGSRYLHEFASAGSELRVRGPWNHFRLVDDADDYILIAGGIGITPLKAMAQHLESRGLPWRLHYGGRSRTSMAYLEEMQQLGSGCVEVRPQDSDGMLDLAGILADSHAGTVVYCCGPGGLLHAIGAVVQNSPVRELHVERFTATASPSPELISEQGEDTFVVELAASGGEVEVTPDRSILDTVRDRLPGVLSSCEDGYCGTCETRVIEGIPLHRDTVLTPSEQDSNETMMICVGRSRSKRLVLDL